MEGRMILGQDQYYSLNDFETGLNNNVLVVGASGAGKTRSVVTPNLLEATGSYIVSDPKGNLYNKYSAYLTQKGYRVKKLDFTDPLHSSHYNCFKYIRSIQDINKMAHMLNYAKNDSGGFKGDPFWDDAAELLLSALIGYTCEEAMECEKTLSFVQKCCDLIDFPDENEIRTHSTLDIVMEDLEKKNPDSFAVKQYKRVMAAANKTLRSIVITLNSKLASYDTPELRKMMAFDDINISSIGDKKTALFVIVSDTDRSLDGLANLFFTQAINELCYVADKKRADSRLKIPVRFILDDFATNCKIGDFPRMIASIRSRGISTMLMIQSEGQLKKGYGEDYMTIIANCDTYLYLGGNDVDTAKMVAERCDVPLKKVLNMPVGTNWLFRRGQEPVNGKNYQIDKLLRSKGLVKESIER